MLLVAPTTDVFYYDSQAAGALLSGSNPYTHTYSGIPARLATPGASSVFAYLPLTAFYLIPSHLLGDVRIGLVFADVIIALTLYHSSRERGLSAMLLYLFAPFTIVFSTIYINNTLVSILFFALFYNFELRGRPLLSSLFLGLSLAAIQVAWVLLPILAFYFLRQRRFTHIAAVLGTAILATLPLAIIDINAFLFDTLFFQFSRPVLGLITTTGPVGFTLDSLLNVNLNLGLNGLMLTFAGFTLPVWLRVGILLLILPLFLRGMSEIHELLRASGLFLLVSLFVLPNDFFLPYVEMPFFILLAYWSISSRRV